MKGCKDFLAKRVTLTLLNLGPLSTDEAVKHSMLFQELPVEIRNNILRPAVGDKTLHMERRLHYPVKWWLKGKKWNGRHAKLPPTSALNFSKELYLEWRDSTCHCVSFPHWLWLEPGRPVPVDYRHRSPCLEGDNKCDEENQRRCSCAIRATGWLLS